MAGSIQKRGKESWLLSYHVGYDSKGKRIRKTRTVQAKNKTEAEKLLAKFIVEVDAGKHITPTKTTFGEYVHLWKIEKEKAVSPSTMENYNYDLKNYILPKFEDYKLKDITHIYINDFLKELENEGLKSATIKRKYNLLNSIFKMIEKDDLLPTNPMKKVEVPKVQHKEGDVYNSKELKELFLLLNEDNNKQMALIVKLALKTGMRKGELLGLQWSDIDFSTNTIHIKRSLSYTKDKGYFLKEPKTKGSNRKVAPPRKLMEELKKHIYIKKTERMEAKELWEGGKYEFVFSTDLGKPLNLDYVNKWWNRFLKRTGFKKIRFHDLRHTASTDLINRGANIHSISKRLGHSNITTTLNIYGHYLEEADQKIADMLDEDYI